LRDFKPYDTVKREFIFTLAIVNIADTSVSSSTVLQTLIYFDIFKYPLTMEEIHRYCQSVMSLDDTTQIIKELVDAGEVYDLDGYFSLRDDIEAKNARIVANELAIKALSKARENGLKISRFPFVRCVCVSGSLSKNVMTEDGDIDYFIISSGDRMWISKLLLIAYKKLILRNSSKYFCLNYFISEKDLVIPEKNLFTSIEIATLIPIVNDKVYSEFIQANDWMLDHIPNAWQGGMRKAKKIQLNKKKGVARIAEFLLSGIIGNIIDDIVLGMYRLRNKRKYSKVNEESFQLMFRSTKTQSKIHASDHQNVIMTKFHKGCKNYNISYD